MNLGDWSIQLNRLNKKLQQGGDFETDKQQAKSIRNPVLKLLFRVPSENFNSTQKDWVLAIRGLVILQSLIANKKPGSQLIDSLTKLLAKKIEYEKIADSNLTAIAEYVISNKQQGYEFLVYTLQKFIVKPLPNLSDLIRPKTALLIQGGANLKSIEPALTTLLLESSNSPEESEQRCISLHFRYPFQHFRPA